MHMARPLDHEFDLEMMNKREPLFAKVAQLYQMGKEESYFDDSFEKLNSSETRFGRLDSKIEVPYCFYAALLEMKA